MGAVIARPPLPPGPFLVLGLARSGVAATRALTTRGGRVVATDARAVGDDVRAALLETGAEVRDGEGGLDVLDGIATLVKSPGVPREAPLVAEALRRGITVIGELELGWRLLGQHEFIALTGSNGKTTTVELIGHIHRVAGAPVVVAGNVGTALTSLPGTLEPGAVVVCEASSFQLEDTLAFAPDAAVLINLQEDHLDRHGTFENYRAAKLAIFAHQPPGTLAVVPAGLELEDAGGEATRVTFGETAALERAAGHGTAGADPDLAHVDGTLYWRGEPLLAAADIRIRGPHNRENAMAAAAVCLARGLSREAVREGLKTFGGVAHRLEEIGTVGGVTYVNDSKATNVASTEVALRSFVGRIRLIAGGSEKGSDFTPLRRLVGERCIAVHLIGETAPWLRAALADSAVPLHDDRDLERAFEHARREARSGDVVLLSPACASYDQFRSYEERGDRSRDLVSATR